MFKNVLGYAKATDRMYLLFCVLCSTLSVLTLTSICMYSGGAAAVVPFSFDSYRPAIVQAGASVMLTGETAAGQYPMQAMEYLVRTAQTALA